MQRWCALLEQEVLAWPHVSSRPMFGMLACYRGANIFAALPRTRAADTPFSLLVKLPSEKRFNRHDTRLARASGPGAGWITFAMESDADIPQALRLLERAYSRTKNKERTTKKKRARTAENEKRQRRVKE